MCTGSEDTHKMSLYDSFTESAKNIDQQRINKSFLTSKYQRVL